VLGAVIGGAVGATQGKKARAATGPHNPAQNAGQSGDVQSATSAIPSSSTAGNAQSPASSDVADFLVPASWQGLGVPS